MLMVVAIGDLVVDDWPLLVLVGCAVAGTLAADALLSRTAAGTARRGAHVRMTGSPDAVETRVHNVARWLPIAVALVVFTGLDSSGGGVALALVVGYSLAQLAFRRLAAQPPR